MSEDENSGNSKEELVTEIINIITGRESSNGNPYSVIITEDYPEEWFFVWEGDFKDDLDDFTEVWQGKEVKIVYKDNEDDPSDHFFSVSKFWPVDKEVNEKLLKLKQKKSGNNENSSRPVKRTGGSNYV